ARTLRTKPTTNHPQNLPILTFELSPVPRTAVAAAIEDKKPFTSFPPSYRSRSRQYLPHLLRFRCRAPLTVRAPHAVATASVDKVNPFRGCAGRIREILVILVMLGSTSLAEPYTHLRALTDLSRR